MVTALGKKQAGYSGLPVTGVKDSDQLVLESTGPSATLIRLRNGSGRIVMLPVEENVTKVVEADWSGSLLLALACVAFVMMCGMRLMW
jgi:hypothetical protein